MRRAASGGVELLAQTLDAHATAFHFGDGFQGEAGIAAQAVQAIDQELIEAVQAGVGKDARTGGTQMEGERAGDAVIGVDGAHAELMESAKSFRQIRAE
jgi:hypothetical protein